MKKNVMRVLICILVLLCLSGCGTTASKTNPISDSESSSKNYTTYECDVKILSLSTKIKIEKEGDSFGVVSGNIMRWVTDPLTMYDTNNKQVAYAGDSYHLFKQDSHGIYVDGTFTYDMVGEISFWGEKYSIYDKDENLVATTSFSPLNLSGSILDSQGNLIAEYSSSIFRYDFTLKIYDNCELDEKSVLMIACSYFSDYKYDNSDD